MASVVYPAPHAQPHGDTSRGTATVARPKSQTGLRSWLTTIDHKRIGIMYGVSAFLFFMLGGFEALLIRVQLARPENTFVDAQRYNELFTMHGTTMVFLALMPMASAFFNYVVPLQIGARDVAFPRLNAFSLWTFVAGAIILNLPVLASLPSTLAYILGQLFGWVPQFTLPFGNFVPDQGWYGYAPLTTPLFSGKEIDFWAFGIQVLGIASLAASFNFIVTIFNMRAPGMTMMRMPIFTWSTLITSILIAMAFPAVTIALVLLSFDRLAGTSFFSPYNLVDGQLIATGGDPLLWQHLFWIFGHPEVYILILPAFGIVSEVIPVFARKPLFGYAVMVYAIAAIAFLGFGVWVHHMFVTGLGPTPDAVFSASTMLIAIPTGVKILNWTATMWGGSLRFSTPMLFAVGLVSQFVIGGLSGVMHAVVPVDSQQNDTYFVVAHFHYVLFGGTVFAIFAGLYYWWPKIFGKVLSERLGKLHFWLTFAGFNLTFFPMHFLGLAGMPRRYWSYGAESGLWFWNIIVSAGALLIAASVWVFLYNVLESHKRDRKAPADPWDGATLEWAIPSPPPVYNFREIPIVTHRDQLWVEKYGPGDHAHGQEDELDVTIAGAKVGGMTVPDEQAGEQAAQRAETLHAEDDAHGIHLPNPSWYPLISSVGLLVLVLGILIDNPHLQVLFLGIPLISLVGAVVMILGFYGWAFEPASDPVHSDAGMGSAH
ncbi:MAG: Cytochrome c oxidase polypeptide I [uncultured Thermomicrobiales bacterium]|uniref:Cytochrome c oxidase subunit 1 n=1 Tax=uncultured Thermomicrobiales bacterium TaxID=1645740 RepID=A0A6J4U3H9_9BACT|nr:MAG: Cytochrome c oxidase polypeptide I [uncultured Thermomicrobiales bacterium]